MRFDNLRKMTDDEKKLIKPLRLGKQENQDWYIGKSHNSTYPIYVCCGKYENAITNEDYKRITGKEFQ